jgi:hypothetical protein
MMSMTAMVPVDAIGTLANLTAAAAQRPCHVAEAVPPFFA